MPGPHGIEIRERAVELTQSGWSIRAIAEVLGIGESSVKRYRALKRDRGSVEPLPMGGSVSKLDDFAHELLTNIVVQDCDATVDEMTEVVASEAGIKAGRSSIDRAIHRLKLSFKKKTYRLKEEDAPALARERKKKAKQIARLIHRAMFLDEFSINLLMSLRYGRSPVGERCFDVRPTARREGHSVIATMSKAGLGPTVAVKGSVNQYIFLTFLIEECLPHVRKGTVFVLDPLPSHITKAIRAVIEQAGCFMLVLPPRSPEMNPIEEAISKMKHLMRKAAARGTDALMQAFQEATELLSRTDIIGWIRHAGYLAGST